MNSAELVRHAAVGFAAGKLTTDSGTLRLEMAALIERIYRGVYLLSTLKRDEMIRAGRQDELEQLAGDARASQAAVRKAASESSA